jgi:hypothetical protein
MRIQPTHSTEPRAPQSLRGSQSGSRFAAFVTRVVRGRPHMSSSGLAHDMDGTHEARCDDEDPYTPGG